MQFWLMKRLLGQWMLLDVEQKYFRQMVDLINCFMTKSSGWLSTCIGTQQISETKHEEGTPIDIVSSLKRYEKSRRLRVAIIHGIARMAALMALTYKAYLDVGLGPLSVGFLVNCTVRLMICIV